MALKSVVIDRMSIARVAAALAISWHTVNDAVLAAGRGFLIEDPHRFEGVKAIGVDEHVEVEATWRIYQKSVTACRCPSKPAGKRCSPK